MDKTFSPISIIVPLFNCRSYVAECLKSILDELADDDELIVVDDGSVDGSADIVEAIFKKHGVGRLIRKDNAGVSSARNAGLDAAHGDWAMFVDADDLLIEGWRNVVENYISEFSEADLIFISAKAKAGYSVDTVSAVNGILGIAKAEQLQAEGMPSVWSKLYKLAPDDNIRGIRFCEKIVHGEDALYNLERILSAQRWAFARANIYRYRVVASSATHSYSPKFLSSNMFFIEELIRALGTNKFLSSEKVIEYRDYCFVNSIFLFARKLAQSDDMKTIVQGAREFYKDASYRKLLEECSPAKHKDALVLFTWHITRLGGLVPLSALYRTFIKHKISKEGWMEL